MASFQIFFASTFFFLLFLPNTASAQICQISYCDGINSPWVEFPFQLNTSQAKRCGYPGFNLSCNNKNQTTLTLPNSGDFHVDYINYQDNLIYITDPDDCFPRRFLKQSFSLLGSPFQLKNTMSNHNYTFYNCSFNKTTHSLSQPIPCLSSDNFTVFKSYYPDKWLQSRCPVILHAPLSVQLSWNNLNCSLCESGEQCALKSDTSLEVGCFDYSSTLSTRTGLSRRAKYGIIIGVGIIGLLCIIWLTCYLSGRASVEIHIRHPNTQLSTLIALRQATLVAGLDGPTIESYPKFVLGESRRLPKANDNTCSICLSEYQPKETLRTIPKCNHYFHANCIDEWLKKKATCPICRIQPINPL